MTPECTPLLHSKDGLGCLLTPGIPLLKNIWALWIPVVPSMKNSIIKERSKKFLDVSPCNSAYFQTPCSRLWLPVIKERSKKHQLSDHLLSPEYQPQV